jgi:hypothetical protein
MPNRTRVSVVIALGHKVNSVRWLEALAEHAHITVFVYYHPANVRPALRTQLSLLSMRNPRFVRVENRFSWAHTEAYVYMVHILVFWKKLSDCIVFLQDDSCDEEYLPCGQQCGRNGHTHDIVQKVVNISNANPPVHFLPLSTTMIGRQVWESADSVGAMGIGQTFAESNFIQVPSSFTRIFFSEVQMQKLQQAGEYIAWKNGLFAVSKVGTQYQYLSSSLVGLPSSLSCFLFLFLPS